MTITITAPGEFLSDSKDAPVVGSRYVLEPAAGGTNAQNRAFHALANEYFRTGLWSYRGSGYREGITFDEFRNTIKRDLGVGFEAYYYADLDSGAPRLREVKNYMDIPQHVRSDPARRDMIRGRLKSWSDYTKKERRETMDKLINEMVAVGVNSPKFREIMDGMEEAFK